MPLKTNIIDGTGTRIHAKVTENHALLVENSSKISLPPIGQINTFRYTTAKLGSTGGDSGTTSMNVDGSSTPQEFFIKADEGFDLHIMNIQVLIADNVIDFSDFGNINGGLSTGFDLFVIEDGLQTDLITKAKTTGQLLVSSPDMDSYQIINFQGVDDAQVIRYPIVDLIPNGIRIARGSTDLIKAVVNDDVTGLAELTVRIFGYKHFPVV